MPPSTTRRSGACSLWWRRAERPAEHARLRGAGPGRHARLARVCDAETRNAVGAPGLALSNCNAHPWRKFRDAERAHPWLAIQGARFIQALYELEDEADELELAGGDRVEFRRRRSRRVLRRFRQWLDGVLARPLPPSDPVRKVAKYYCNHFDDLTRFVDHAELPLDNNEAERECQRHAKLRQACVQRQLFWPVPRQLEWPIEAVVVNPCGDLAVGSAW